MPECPTPTKVAYNSQRAAIAAALRASRHHGPLRIYPCLCGHLHLTSKIKGRRRRRKPAQKSA